MASMALAVPMGTMSATLAPEQTFCPFERRIYRTNTNNDISFFIYQSHSIKHFVRGFQRDAGLIFLITFWIVSLLSNPIIFASQHIALATSARYALWMHQKWNFSQFFSGSGANTERRLQPHTRTPHHQPINSSLAPLSSVNPIEFTFLAVAVRTSGILRVNRNQFGCASKTNTKIQFHKIKMLWK